jgi:hypothetical protein
MICVFSPFIHRDRKMQAIEPLIVVLSRLLSSFNFKLVMTEYKAHSIILSNTLDDTE